MNPDRLLLREQSDLGPYCLQSTSADERVDDNCLIGGKKVKTKICFSYPSVVCKKFRLRSGPTNWGA